uniref:Uncharacterized protein n=1 Tax=Trypanosoma vivax (strain Y486) TaxID=1055687 RepID=G0TSW9_TRYVY|nr:hypothetical protein TVY486_0302350 [Trypanosoma vivax Y486]
MLESYLPLFCCCVYFQKGHLFPHPVHSPLSLSLSLYHLLFIFLYIIHAVKQRVSRSLPFYGYLRDAADVFILFSLSNTFSVFPTLVWNLHHRHIQTNADNYTESQRADLSDQDGVRSLIDVVQVQVQASHKIIEEWPTVRLVLL